MDPEAPEGPSKPASNRYSNAGSFSLRKVSTSDHVGPLCTRSQRPSLSVGSFGLLQVLLIVVGFNCILNLILVVTTLVRPTPNFSNSVLFSLRSAESASLTRRGYALERTLPRGSVASELIHLAVPRARDSLKRSEYWISAGFNLQCRVESARMECQVWNDGCGCWITQQPALVYTTETTTQWKHRTALTTITSYVTKPTSASIPSSSSAISSLSNGAAYSTSRSRTAHRSHHTSSPPQSIDLSHTRTSSSKTRHNVSATATSTTATAPPGAAGNSSVLAGLFQGLWVSEVHSRAECSITFTFPKESALTSRHR